jgi:HEAT repeat protein
MLKWRRVRDRISAVEQLGQYCTASSLGALLCLDDRDSEVRAAVAAALDGLREHSQWDELVAAFNEGWGGEKVQAFAVGVLGRKRDKRSLAFVLSATRSGLEQVRLAAYEVLSESSDPEALRALISALEDGFAPVRALAVRTLAKNPGLAVAPELVKRICDPNAMVRAAAACAIAVVRAPNAFELVGPMLQDSDEKVRHAAVEALGTLKDARAVSLLITASGRGEERWVKAIADALEYLHGQTTQDLLLSAIRDHSPLPPPIGNWMAGEFNLQRDGQGLACLLAGQDELVTGTAMRYLRERMTAQTAPTFYLFLKPANPGLRLKIIELLTPLKVESAIDPLIEVLPDTNLGVRAAAIRALGAIGGPRAEQAIKSCAGEGHEIVRVACIEALRNSKDSVGLLIDWYGDQREDVRRAVIQSLETLEHPDAVDLIIAASADGSDRVRQAAAQALAISTRLPQTPALEAYRALETSVSLEAQARRIDQAIEILARLTGQGHQRLNYNLARAIWRKATLFKDSGDHDACGWLFHQAAEMMQGDYDLRDLQREKSLWLAKIGDKAGAVAAYEAVKADQKFRGSWKPAQDVEFYAQLVNGAGKAEYADCLARAQVEQADSLYRLGTITCTRCGGRGWHGGGTLTGGRHYDIQCTLCYGRKTIDVRWEASRIMDRALETYDRLVREEGHRDLRDEMNKFKKLRETMKS